METTVITYGTYDLFHEGHRRILERARKLGDRLIVGVTSDEYDRSRGKLNVAQSLAERIDNVMNSGLADRVIVEEYEGQKIHDIERLGVDTFVIGSDWLGKFEYLKPYCDVVYLDRTKGVSSTQLRNDSSGILQIGLVGAGRDAKELVKEARYVSGISVEAVWSPNSEKTRKFAKRMELRSAASSYEELLHTVDAVYISTSFKTRADRIRQALESGKHVLAEPPFSASAEETQDLFALAEENEVALIPGVRTAYSPGFLRMVAYARSGSIGAIRSVQISSTRHSAASKRSQPDEGVLSNLGTYPLLAVVKLLGTGFTDLRCQVLQTEEGGPEQFARIDLTYPGALASVTLGDGVVSRDDLRVSGTAGSLYVPAPWWITDHFSAEFHGDRREANFFVPFEGGGQRYELAELAARAKGDDQIAYKMSDRDSLSVSRILHEAANIAAAFGVHTQHTSAYTEHRTAQ